MRNVHLITKQQEENVDILPQYLYITSEEAIKEGDKIINPTNEIQTCIGFLKGIGIDNICWIKVKETTTLQQILNSQKIILTDNPELIAEGVQAIDNEFLEWFVKNPSCERVEVKYVWEGDSVFQGFSMGNASTDGTWRYQIIIPQEEYQMTGCYFIPSNNTSSATICNNCGKEKFLHTIGKDIKVSKSVIITQEEPKQIKCYCGHTTYCDCGPLEEPKQETVQKFIEQHGITEQQLIDGYKQGLQLIFENASKITK